LIQKEDEESKGCDREKEFQVSIFQNIQHPTSNIQHPTSNIQHPTSNIEHRTSNIHPNSEHFFFSGSSEFFLENQVFIVHENSTKTKSDDLKRVRPTHVFNQLLRNLMLTRKGCSGYVVSFLLNLILLFLTIN